MTDYIRFNGIPGSANGVYLAKKPEDVHSKKRYTEINIPGRSGSIILDEGLFENHIQTYDIYVPLLPGMVDDLAEEGGLSSITSDIVTWLNGGLWFARDDYEKFHPLGFFPLEDSNHINEVRWARWDGELRIEDRNDQILRAEIRFLCLPYYYYIEDLEPVDASVEIITELDGVALAQSVQSDQPLDIYRLAESINADRITEAIQDFDPTQTTYVTNLHDYPAAPLIEVDVGVNPINFLLFYNTIYIIDGQKVRKIIIDCENERVIGYSWNPQTDKYTLNYNVSDFITPMPGEQLFAETGMFPVLPADERAIFHLQTYDPSGVSLPGSAKIYLRSKHL